MKRKIDIDSLIRPDIVGARREELKGRLSLPKYRPVLKVARSISQVSEKLAPLYTLARAAGHKNAVVFISGLYDGEISSTCRMSNVEGLAVFDIILSNDGGLCVLKARNITSRAMASVVRGASDTYVTSRINNENTQTYTNVSTMLTRAAALVPNTLRDYMKFFISIYGREFLYQENHVRVSTPKLHALLDTALNGTARGDISDLDKVWMTNLQNSINTSMQKFFETTSKLDAMFACKKWVIMFDVRSADSYIDQHLYVGAIDATAAVNLYRAEGELGFETNDIEVVVPFREYESLSALPQDIKDSLLPSLLMAKVNSPHMFSTSTPRTELAKQIDPDYLIPCFTSNQMSLDAGFFLHDPVYMVDM